MSKVKNYGKNLMTKAGPAAGGGIAAKVLNKLVDNVVKDMPELADSQIMQYAKPLAPAILASFLLDGSPAMQFAAAGMIGASFADAASPTIDEMLGDETVLADDDLEEIFFEN